MLLESAPRCVNCYWECPNGLMEYPLFVICQNKQCENYGLFQAWDKVMEKLDKEFPIT